VAFDGRPPALLGFDQACEQIPQRGVGLVDGFDADVNRYVELFVGQTLREVEHLGDGPSVMLEHAIDEVHGWSPFDRREAKPARRMEMDAVRSRKVEPSGDRWRAAQLRGRLAKRPAK